MSRLAWISAYFMTIALPSALAAENAESCDTPRDAAISTINQYYQDRGKLENQAKNEETHQLFRNTLNLLKSCGISFLHPHEFNASFLPYIIADYVETAERNGFQAEAVKELEAVQAGLRNNPAQTPLDQANMSNGVSLLMIQLMLDLEQNAEARKLYRETRATFFAAYHPVYFSPQHANAELDTLLNKEFLALITRVYRFSERPDIENYILANWQ